MSDDPRLRRVLEELSALVYERLVRHPLGHLAPPPAAGSGPPPLEVRLPIPLDPTGVGEDAVQEVEQALAAEVDALLSHRAIVQPGGVYCLRCTRADCEHARPTDPRQIFAGYGPSGLPRFVDFAQWLLERKHPELDNLYQKPPRLVAEPVAAEELTAELLKEFRDRATDFQVHGQVVAGWFDVARANGSSGVIALTLQVVSSGRRGPKGRRRRRLGLNVLAQGPDGEPLAELYHRLGESPWATVVGWCQRILDDVERSMSRKRLPKAQLQGRIDGALKSVARRLAQSRRAEDRRTAHASQRHREGDRPTRMALHDLAHARSEAILADVRRGTLVVLGPRGRAHVWSTTGKLVTSIRATGDAVERKKRQQIWRPASGEEIAGLRKTAGVGEAGTSKTPAV